MVEIDFNAVFVGRGWDRVLASLFIGVLIGVVIPTAWILSHVVPHRFFLPVLAGVAVIAAMWVPLLGEGLFSSWAIPVPILYQGLMLAACSGSDTAGCALPGPLENLWISIGVAIVLGSAGFLAGKTVDVVIDTTGFPPALGR